jgi:hypothetical protein
MKIFEKLGLMQEKKTSFFFFCNFFATFRRKPGILILDLYLYIIKIQTNINQNGIKIHKKITNFKKDFGNFFGICCIQYNNNIL